MHCTGGRRPLVAAALVAALVGCGNSESTPFGSASGAGAMGGSGGTGGAVGGMEGGSGPCTPGATEACYDGPPSTEDVGLCHGGLRTCNAEGTGFGACEGQVLPVPDLCATPEDEDCSGSPVPCRGGTAWSQRYGSTGDEIPTAVAVDAQGNIVIVGRFYNTTDLGGGPMVSAGDWDIFVVKLDSSGSHLWSKRFGTTTLDQCYAMAVDSQGNVVMAGGTQQPIDFGGGPINGTPGGDLFLVKLDANGNHVWSKGFGATQAPGQGVAVDGQDDIYVTGYMQGTANFGGSSFSVGGVVHIYVAKFTSAGTHLFSTVLGGDSALAIGDVIGVDGSNAMFIGGHFEGTINLGGADLVSSFGGHDIFLAKLGANGAHQWSKRFGGQGTEFIYDVQVDAGGAVLIAGIIGSGTDFGGGTLGSGMDDLFVAKLDGQGNHQFSKSYYELGNPKDSMSGWVTTDSAGNAFATGSTRGSIDFGGCVKQGGMVLSVAFVAMDPSGAHIASAIYDGGSDEYGDGIAADPTGGVVAVGHFPASIDFGDGNGPLTSAGGFDMFVARIAP